MFWYHVLDYFFLLFHTALTLFNVLGWIWRKTRLANFITLAFTALSWFGLGLFYGIGFCPLTEWHWQVLEKLGQHNLPYSYITYLIHRIIGLDVSSRFVDISTVVVFFLSFFISGYMNFFLKKKRSNKP